jgi:H+/Cl- antiporter ClcA
VKWINLSVNGSTVMKWLLWLLFSLCPVGIGLGVCGVIISHRLHAFATVEVLGISPWIFEELICGAIILFMYVCTVAMLRRSVDPDALRKPGARKPKLHSPADHFTS